VTSSRYDPAARSTRELLADWAAIMRVLRERGVIRTNNNPIGDIAEAIVHEHFGGERGSFVQAGWDVKTADGARLQVKALRRTVTSKRRNLSPIRDRDYDAVVVVIFREDFSVEEGLWISRALVERLFEHRPYVNGRIVAVTQALMTNPEVRHIDLSDSLLDA
jgi:hypothetical protein